MVHYYRCPPAGLRSAYCTRCVRRIPRLNFIEMRILEGCVSIISCAGNRHLQYAHRLHDPFLYNFPPEVRFGKLDSIRKQFSRFDEVFKLQFGIKSIQRYSSWELIFFSRA